jgi:class 3 adenylate cyclase
VKISENFSGLTVLVVDDSSTARKVLARHLSELGCTVVEARDAEKALKRVHEFAIDACLLDINLPGMSGFDLCRHLRVMDRFRHVPILFVTALDETEVVREAFAAGGDDVLIKPVAVEVLAARLLHHLQCLAVVRRLDTTQRNLNLYLCPRTQEMAQQHALSGHLPAPEVREVCVLFSDVRGFTQLSQELEPQLLFNVLSEHLGAQVHYVYRFGGYIDKFSGDGIMAVFDGPEMAVNSCLCALKILEYAQQQAQSSVAPLYQLGIGIHQGEVMIGNIGTDRQLDYTVIGPTVNLAARLCGHAAALSVVISDAVRRGVKGDPRFNFDGPHLLSIKGVKVQVPAFVLTPGKKGDMVAPVDDLDALPI